MAAYVFPEIPELTGKEAAEFIRKAENPTPVKLSALDKAMYAALTQKPTEKKA
jgi:hypothetical protein